MNFFLDYIEIVKFFKNNKKLTSDAYACVKVYTFYIYSFVFNTI